MATEHIEQFKKEVKKEFNARKKTEDGLKLSHVYNDLSRRNGYKDWNWYRKYLEQKIG